MSYAHRMNSMYEHSSCMIFVLSCMINVDHWSYHDPYNRLDWPYQIPLRNMSVQKTAKFFFIGIKKRVLFFLYSLYFPFSSCLCIELLYCSMKRTICEENNKQEQDVNLKMFRIYQIVYWVHAKDCSWCFRESYTMDGIKEK